MIRHSETVRPDSFRSAGCRAEGRVLLRVGAMAGARVCSMGAGVAAVVAGTNPCPVASGLLLIVTGGTVAPLGSRRLLRRKSATLMSIALGLKISPCPFRIALGTFTTQNGDRCV